VILLNARYERAGTGLWRLSVRSQIQRFTEFTDSRGGVDEENRIIIKKPTPTDYIENCYYLTNPHHLFCYRNTSFSNSPTPVNLA
jgi:hypothetical protein